MDGNVVLYLKEWQYSALVGLNELRNADLLCDTLLVLDSGMEVPCHACVLAATVPVLKSQILEEFATRFSNNSERTCKISVKSVPENQLRHVLNFCYTGHIEISKADVNGLLEVCKTLSIKSLEKLCERVLLKSTGKQTTDKSRKKRKLDRGQGHNTSRWTRSRTKSENEINENVSGHENNETEFSSSDTALESDQITDCKNINELRREDNLTNLDQDSKHLVETFTHLSDNDLEKSVNDGNDVYSPEDIAEKDVNNESSPPSLPPDINIKEELNNMELSAGDNCSYKSGPAIVEQKDLNVTVSERNDSHVTENGDEKETDFTFDDTVSTDENSDSLEQTDAPSHDTSDNAEVVKKKRKKKKYKYELECTICDKIFVTRASLNDHMNTHTGVKPYKCPECNKSYGSRQSLKDHVKIHRGLEFDCEVCGKKLLSRKRLNAHMKNHGPDWKPRMKDRGDYECSVCNKQFVSYKSFGDHMNIHKGLKPFKCKVCGKAYSSRLSLKGHMPIHKDEVHICDTCGKCCPTRRYLRRHLKEHEISELRKGTLPSHHCFKCGKKYYTEKELQRHENTIHSDTTGHICPRCGKKYKTKMSMSAHYTACTQTGKFNCDFCEKNYSSRETLKKHISWAHKEEMLASEKYKDQVMYCTYCNKVFLSKNLLQVHENLHTGAQKFSCDICHKSFNSISNLGTHKRNVHLDVPDQYQCTICTTTTKSLRAFKRHQKIHMSNPEYTCKHCNKNYNRRDMLNAHLQSCGPPPSSTPVTTNSRPVVVNEYYQPLEYTPPQATMNSLLAKSWGSS